MPPTTGPPSPDDFVVVPDVALLDEHTLMDDDGKPLVHLDAAKLQRIADTMNRRVKQTGDETPVVVGHTRDGVAEEQQPEIVGWARDFAVKPFFRTGKKALFCTWRILK